MVNWPSLEDEATGIAEFINVRINRDNIIAGEILVLCPTRQTGYLIRDKLNENYGIEAHSFFTEEILDSKYAQTAFTLLRLLIEPDDRVALRCWLGLDHSDRRYAEYMRIHDYLRQTIYKSLREILDQLFDGTITIKNTKGIVSRYTQLKTQLAQLSDKTDQEKFNILFPLEEEWAKPFHEIISKLPEEDSTLRDMYELIREHIIQPERPSNATYVRIMSFHSSKGLEFDLVIVTGCINGFVPRNPDPKLSQADQTIALEEQKRLFYVSITRAKRELVLSIPQSVSRDLAHRFKMEFPIYGYGDVNTFTSSFITKDLGSVLPLPVRYDLWQY